MYIMHCILPHGRRYGMASGHGSSSSCQESLCLQSNRFWQQPAAAHVYALTSCYVTENRLKANMSN